MTTLTAIQIQGNLIAPDMTAELIAGNIKGQNLEDFGLTKTDKDEEFYDRLFTSIFLY